MATDYDAVRKRDDEPEIDSVEEAKQVAGTARKSQQPDIDVDDGEAAESFELPGADLSHVDIAIEVVPQQRDEFTCTVCFLVHHYTALASAPGEPEVCADCAVTPASGGRARTPGSRSS